MIETPHVVYHVAAMGDWKEVVVEQMRTLAKAGLKEICITHVGDGLEWLMAEAEHRGLKAILVRSDPNVMHYETFAMFEIERLAKVSDRPILYLHTKGVSRPDIHAKRMWRRLMDHYIVSKWRENVAILAEKDAVGVNWLPCDHDHFAGNFWIARADWIRKLPNYTEFHNRHNRVRFTCEWWIGSTPGCRSHSHVCSGEYWGDDREEHFKHRMPAEASPPTITWVSGATRGYEKDLARLQASCERLGAGHRFQFFRWDSTEKFRHTLKFDLMRKVLRICETSHLLWIDADCEFVQPVEPWDFSSKPLVTIRHFGSDSPLTWLPQRLKARVAWPITSTSWQSCVFGGEIAAVSDQLRRLEWMDREGHTYDEHGLVMDWSQRESEVLTLPCRYATPTTFGPFPEYEQKYRERCGGEPVILHHNRNLNPR